MRSRYVAMGLLGPDPVGTSSGSIMEAVNLIGVTAQTTCVSISINQSIL